MLGGPLAGWMIDFFGRKIALILAGFPFCIGWLLIGLGKNAPMLYSGRFISGLAVGMASLIVPVCTRAHLLTPHFTDAAVSHSNSMRLRARLFVLVGWGEGSVRHR